ncbi:MAG: histidine--tRNA ligase [Candidatus Marinimicrobia bacterium]|nr:histidine--tRNA ligase [Candidatus Neomarinimicrobiota bacterium]|tara:strand:+ start:73518 stop:74789 length:1272 start_codon:yes stop_codon:yes gene_type:complete
MTKNIIRSVKGTKDILPGESSEWQKIEKSFRNFIHRYGYREIRTPVFEKTELFARGVGEGTDIVTKEMYTWEDRNGDSLTLKPELTAPVVRAYIQHNLGTELPLTKLYYFDSLFRRERPQKGRQRQFHQFGIEAIGSPFPELDAEIISAAYLFLSDLGLSKLKLKINSIGSNIAREMYSRELVNFIKPLRNKLSKISQKRLETNPLRILDTKIPEEIDLLKNAPDITKYLTNEDQEHFQDVVKLLEIMEIPFILDSRMVRGLDYYSRTTFEITSDSLGGQDALCGGGRYDSLVESLGGKPTPAMGFAAGVERILIALGETQISNYTNRTDIFIITMSKDSLEMGISLSNILRKEGFYIGMDSLRRSVKSQFREANKLRAQYALILGEEEMKQNKVTVKQMSSSDQSMIDINSISSFFKKSFSL